MNERERERRRAKIIDMYVAGYSVSAICAACNCEPLDIPDAIEIPRWEP